MVLINLTWEPKNKNKKINKIVSDGNKYMNIISEDMVLIWALGWTMYI